MIPDDGSRLKVIENGVLKKWERRRVVVLKEKLYTVTFIKLYIITKYLLILLLCNSILHNPSTDPDALTSFHAPNIYISFFFVFLFF